MRIKKHFHYMLAVFLMVVFPAFVWLVGILLRVDTVSVTSSAVVTRQAQGATEYLLSLSRPRAGESFELMFETAGNVVEITAGDSVIYTYGADIAASGRMIGPTFVHVFLPESAYEQPLRILLAGADKGASDKLDLLELCPHSDSLRYYITHKTLGMPLALVLISMSFAIPVFLLLGNERRLLCEGLLFGTLLLCFSVLLLSHGGHYLVFFANQLVWGRVYYLARYLLPLLVLLYCWAREEAPAQRRVLLGMSLLNGVFFAASAVLGLLETVHFCDFSTAYALLLGADGLAVALVLVCHIRQKRLFRTHLLMLMASVVGAAFMVLGNFAVAYAFPAAGLPDFEPLEIVAVFLFYGLCGLFAEVAARIQRSAEKTVKQLETLKKNEQSALSTTVIAKEMLAYESIYVIDPQSAAYTCYYETSAHGDLGVASSGDDFFKTIAEKIPGLIAPEDREYVLQMLSRQAVLEGTRTHDPYTFIHRVMAEKGGSVYHKVRAIRRSIGGKEWILLGIRDIDDAMRREKAHMDQRESMLQKEATHMEAILASAAGYLEANLSRDVILELSLDGSLGSAFSPQPQELSALSFSGFMRDWGSRWATEGREEFLSKNHPDFLLRCFERGERRVSVLFSFRAGDEAPTPCRQVIFLYRDKVSGDVMSFHVMHDLTEQQKKEKERLALENALRMSRIRVFTGQMQPHFLYNALGSIQEVMLYDPAYASELLGDFTIHLRGSIRAMSSDDPIPFAQELENIRAYTNIEKMRFGKKLKVVLETGVTGFSTLPLSIQPLVENAIRHGIYERGARGGTVTVRSREDASSWIVEVEDDGVGFDVERVLAEEKSGRSASTGLINVLFRMEKVMGAQVRIQSEREKGTLVRVIIPKKEKE